MAESAKRFYLCNLIPLWEIDEKDMEVDWPNYYSYFGSLIDMKADIFKRDIEYIKDDGETVHPDLKIRFEIYESDYLLSGGLNDHMATYSSHSGYGDKPTVRPIKIVDSFKNIPDADKEKYIFIKWTLKHEYTLEVTDDKGKKTKKTEKVPKSLKIRCWWKVVEESGGDVSGNPEYYYDVFVQGKLKDGKEFKLEERSDHEMKGFSWHVTKNVRKGRVEHLVDGEYAFIKMLQLMDSAKKTIHILNWKMDPLTNLVVEPKFQGDYYQLNGMTPKKYEELLVRCKPLTLGVSVKSGVFFYSASNGNIVSGVTDPVSIAGAVRQIDDPTNLDYPTGVLIAGLIPVPQVLILDQLRSRLLLFILLPPNPAIVELYKGQDKGLYLVRMTAARGLIFSQVRPTIPGGSPGSGKMAGLINIAGDGNPGYQDGGLAMVVDNNKRPTGMYRPMGKMNHPTGLVIAEKNIYITDTGNHCIRKVANYDPADILKVLKDSPLKLTTLAGKPEAGNTDGTGAAARFNSPAGIAWDSKSKQLLVADTGNKKIRAVKTTGGKVTSLDIKKIDGSTGSISKPSGLAFNPDQGTKGTLYIAEIDKHRILELDLDKLEAKTLAGSKSGATGYKDGTTAEALFNNPMGLSFDDGKLYAADSENHVLREIDPAAKTVKTIGSKTKSGEQDVPVSLADVLRRKAAQGVDVRILLDHYGCTFSRDGKTPFEFAITGQQASADLKFLNPKIQSFVQELAGYASSHEKMIVIDGKHGVAGGIDFDDDKNDGLNHNRDHRVSIFWHDVAAFVEGKAAYGLEETFARRWKIAHDSMKDKKPPPDKFTAKDNTDATIKDHDAETIRTFDPSPLFGFLPNLIDDTVEEILESYRRAILAARYYVYMEHQYLYYPKILEFIEQAMKDNKDLRVIWVLPFFTEESRDPEAEKAELEIKGALKSAIVEPGASKQAKAQASWHGLFMQHKMVKKLRGLYPDRFGVFSIQRLVPRPTPREPSEPPEEMTQMIYPHSKMILCDDRFFSIGSANANGRGFVKDGELNVSCFSPDAAKALRIRLWGEHLGFQGIAELQTNGKLLLLSGHHLEKDRTIHLRHPAISTLEHKIKSIDAATGQVELDGPPIPVGTKRIYWEDPEFAKMPPTDFLKLWRLASHPLDIYQIVHGKAKVDSNGDLKLKGHKAKAGDFVVFNSKFLVTSGNSSGETAVKGKRYMGGYLKVKSVTADTIKLESPPSPWGFVREKAGEFAAMKKGDFYKISPFKFKVFDSKVVGSKTFLVFTIAGLIPGLKEVPYDYHVSWLKRQPAKRQLLRTWEIVPPKGVEYEGPGSVFFTFWNPLYPLIWLFMDVDVNEMVKLEKSGEDGKAAFA